MKLAELREKTISELEGILLDHKKELFNLRFQQASATLANSSRIRQVKRLVARIHTVINEKKVA